MNSKLSVRGFNMWAEGFSIFSYGRHFEIARWYPTRPRKGMLPGAVPAMCVLFNSEGYSVSTSKHKKYTRRAIRGSAEVFELPTPLWPNSADPREALKYFEAKALESFEAATRARVYASSHLERAEGYLREAERFALCFGVAKYHRPAVDELRAKAQRQAEAARVAALKATREAHKRRAELREKQRPEFEAWMNGGSMPYPPSEWRTNADGAAFIRRSPDGANLETSQGAAVPWEHALRVFRFVKLCRERGEGWQRNGHSIRVGHYTLDSVSPDGSFRAGCHVIQWAQISALAASQGVADATPSAEAVTPSEGAH
jgi:hypothetical protein